MIGNKYIVIVLVAIIAILLVGIGLTFNNQKAEEIEYTDIYISNASTLTVPLSNESQNSTDGYGIKFYNDPKYNLNITSFNSEEEPALSGAVQMAAIRDNTQLGCKPVNVNGTTIYENSTTGVYSVFDGNDTTHDNFLIVSNDKNLVVQTYNSIKYATSSGV